MGRPAWPQLGRDTESDAVRAALCGRDGVCGALLVGAAGVGKTTLARSVIAALHVPVHWVAGTESARDIPLGSFAHLLGTPAPEDPLAMLAGAFHTARSGRYAVIGVDDVPLLDHLSAALLHQLALDGSVRIVATARDGDEVPETITALCKDGYLARVELGPLSRAELARLLPAALGGRVEELSADLIWAASRGNVMFVRHLVEAAREAGALRCVQGVWQLRGQAPATAIAPLLRRRLDLLPDGEKRVLHLLAVCEPLPWDVLAGLVDPEALERADGRGLLRLTEDAGPLEVHLSHTVLADVVRHGLGTAATRRLKSEILAAMAHRPPRTAADRLRLAELVLETGTGADPAPLIVAAEDALALMNIGMAERFARAAVARGGGLVAGELLARSLLWQGDAAQAEKILSGFDPDTLSEFDLARWGIARIANLQWAIGDREAAGRILDMLQRRITHPGLRLVLDGLTAALLVLDCRLDEAITLADAVLDAPGAPPIAVAWGVFGGAMAAALRGRPGEAARFAERGRAISGEIDALLRFLLAFGEVRALVLAGDFAAAQRLSGDIVRITSPGQYRARAMANVLAGTVEVGRGQLRAARARLEETLAALSEESAAAWNLPARWLLVQCYSGLGDVQKAAGVVAELRDVLDRGGDTMFTAPVLIAQAWLAAAEGDLGGAVATATDAADLAAGTGQRAIELMALHAAARFGDRACLPRLVEVARAVGGPLGGADAEHAAGLLNDDAAQVFSAAREFERIGTLLSAADAAAQAAVLFGRGGDRRHALEAAAMADRLAAACGGLRTPALRTSSQPLPLSRREREIADLVSCGLTNREIATRLVVSVRTVEGHLYRMFHKLNVSDREDLTILIRRGAGPLRFGA